MKVKLESERDTRGAMSVLTESEPFVINARGVLIHRPRTASTYKISKNYNHHYGITYWCGNTQTGWSKFTFTSDPPKGRIVCHACEARAVMAGQLPSNEIVGRHVHIGRMRAIKDCCGGGD